MPKRICETCSKEFETKPSQIEKGGGRFCSRKCYGLWRSKKLCGGDSSNWKGGCIQQECRECGVSFYVVPSQIKQGRGFFCSRKCAGIARSKVYYGESHPCWKGGGIKRKCQICGESFFVQPAQVIRGGGKYCSIRCKGHAQNKQVIKVCKVCGKQFSVKLSKIKEGNGIYCSRSCARKADIKTRRHKVKPTKTKPEAIFESFCIKNRLPFRFVGDGSFWIHNINPDFIHLTRRLCVEVFGDYWHSSFFNKNIRYIQTVDGRGEQLKAEGYKLIVIWERDLKRKDAEAFVLYTLEKHNIFPSPM